MKRLLYISTIREPLRPGELDGLLRQARRVNAAVGITGILVAGGRRFLQLLEGPAGEIERVFDRIARDPRHFAIVRLSHKDIVERQTTGWAMAYHGAQAGRDLPELVNELLKEVKDPGLAMEFAQFAKRHAA